MTSADMMPSVVAAKGADQAAAVPHLKLGPIAGYLLKAGIIPEWLMTSDRSTGTIWQAAGRRAVTLVRLAAHYQVVQAQLRPRDGGGINDHAS